LVVQTDNESIGADVYAPVAARDVLGRLCAKLPRSRRVAKESTAATPCPFLPQSGAAITQDRLWQALGVRAETEDEFCSALEAAAAAHRDGRYSLIEVILAPGDIASVLAQYMGLPK
jgi:hypothetical protein